MKHILLIATLSVSLSAKAQYIYFNNLYEIEEANNSLNYKIYAYDSLSYLSFGQMNELSENDYLNGSILRRIDQEGIQIYRHNQTYDFVIGPAGMGIPNESVLRLANNGFVQFHGTTNDMQGSAPLLIKFNENLDTAWTQRVLLGATPPNTDGHANEIFGCGLTNISDTSFMLLTFNRWGWSANPDSLRLRYLTFDYDGNVLANHVQPVEEYLSVDGIRKLSSDRLITWGTLYEDGDRQVFIRKSDMSGNVVDSLILGNPDNRPEGDNCGIYIDNNGTILFSYMRCLEHNSSIDNLFEMVALRLDTTDFSILQEVTYNIPSLEISGQGADVVRIIPASDYGYVLIGRNALNSNTSPRNNIIRVNDELNIVWQNEYSAGVDFYAETMDDIITAQDGGYIATGTTNVIFDDFSLMQKNWILKIDACGYEQPSGCPAVVSTDDEETKISSDIQLWPNPCHNILKAVLPMDAASVRLYDQTGRVVLEEKVYYPNQEWNVSGLECGVYVLEMVRENSLTSSIKIVKN